MKNIKHYRTDLALESADTGDEELPQGVSLEKNEQNGVVKTVVTISTKQAAERLGRPIGRYITLECEGGLGEAMEDALTLELAAMLPAGAVLVAGLGNRSITPDALGPDVANKIIVTRHIPIEQKKALGLDCLREVCALAPGAMGQTGIETADVIAMVTGGIEFAAVVAVDALAARSMHRLGATIQLANSGISPGSGVHNRRSSLTEESLGVPVLSLGIPTVVDVNTIITDLAPADYAADPAVATMIVTPRDIDSLIAKGVKIIASALNRALQNELSQEEVRALME